ncbi:MAG: translocation and assembly module TamB [Vicingaceae bacterium]
MLFIRSPWGQSVIVKKVSSFVSEKTNTTVEIEKLYITFAGNVFLEKLFLNDTKGDTLLYTESLEASIALIPLILAREINLDYLEWSGLTANVNRMSNSENFNFNFLNDVFSTSNDSSESTHSNNSEALKLSIGEIHFSNFELAYNDQLLGIKSKAIVEDLYLKANEIDLENLRFEIEALKIKGTTLNYKQTKAFSVSTKEEVETGSILPYFKINNLVLDATTVHYQSYSNQIKTDVHLAKFSLSNLKLNTNKQVVNLSKIHLKNSAIDVFVQSDEKLSNANVTEGIVWPQWQINVNKISLLNDSFTFRTSTRKDKPNTFNPEHPVLTAVNLEAKNVQYKPEELRALFQSLSFKERSNFKLNNLGFELNLRPKLLTLSNLDLRTPNNRVEGNLSLAFASFDKLLKDQEFQTLSLDLPNLSLNAKDAFYFDPELRKDTFLQALSKNDLVARLKTKGNLKELNVSELEVKWGESTGLNAKGMFRKITVVDSLRFTLNTFNLTTNKKDILTFVDQKAFGVEIPKKINLFGSASGQLDDLKAEATLTIPEGEVKVSGSFANKEQLMFYATLSARDLEVGKLINSPNLGIVNLTLKTKGKGKDLNSLHASFSSNIEHLQLLDYDYSGLQLEGELKNGEGKINASFKDHNLNSTLNAQFTLDSINPVFDLNLNVIGAELNALGVTEKQLKTAFQLTAHFRGNENAFLFHSDLNNDVVVFNQKPYSLGNLKVHAESNSESSTATIKSDFLNLELNATASYNKLFKATENQLFHYLTDNESVSTSDSVKMKLNLSIKEAAIITEVIAPELQYDSIRVNLSFNRADQQLNAHFVAPNIRYKESSVEDMLFTANGNTENLNFDFRFSELNSDPIKIPKTTLIGEFKEQTALFDFIIADAEGKLMQVKSEIHANDNGIVYHINPDSLLLNRSSWNILPGNEILFSEKAIVAKDFDLTRVGQELVLRTQKNESNKEVLELIFDNFELSTLTNFLNTENSIASGEIKGNLIIENPLEEMGIVSDLIISELRVMDIPLGKLQLKAESQKNEVYEIDLSMKGSSVDLDFSGGYTAQKDAGLLDFNLDLKRLNLEGLEKVSSEYLSNLNGRISATAELSGTIEKPEYKGNIDFYETLFEVNSLNAPFTLPNEGIAFTTNKIEFNNFLLQDREKNTFKLNGKIFTEDLLNPTFDLSLKADKFEVLNSNHEDNDLFYGKVNLNTNLTIKGDLNVPIIRGEFGINENSKLTYIVPEEELDLIERDGIILFVNKKNPSAILTRLEESIPKSAAIKGYDLTTTLKVGKNVDFNIIVDQQSGDNLKIKGEGDFKLGLEPNGRTTLAGKYEMSGGYYEASLYNIVKRRFDIAKGSSIVWSGNPLGADMNIQAIYKIETSSSGLMASTTSGQGIGVANNFRKKLPFLVYLNFDGELLKPKISFQLDMPESSQGELGGQVYSKVQQLNTQEEELNKQVFSLLVLNQFFPTTSNDGTSGGSADLARGNVTKVLEDQLNNFSNKYLGKTGLELDFGVDSYTDYQDEVIQNKTQVDVSASKKLFNDQLIVQVGSGVSIEENSGPNQQNTPVVGNVSLEYLFTEDGKWRIKGFRKNEFENVIEGQLIVTGISIIFQKEFNKFNELLEEVKQHQNAEEKTD